MSNGDFDCGDIGFEYLIKVRLALLGASTVIKMLTRRTPGAADEILDNLADVIMETDKLIKEAADGRV
jgi:hypothetical protein